ncbi:SAM-dependent methyltransferase [Brevundimonas aveniformis]|uniref:SAM-dependent methyltransferase n=1 Tax=Brevundimonas aveniformis TaxID=370977 RepID=UPI000410B7B3|nr:methyltransferase domain-containing protein [Brevundimonas aveniformis]
MTDLNLAAYPHMGIANPVSEDAVSAMLELTGLEPGDRAAELGCGNGALARLLAGWGLRVLAVDRSAAMAGLARRRMDEAGLSKAVEVVAGDAADVAEARGPFRLVAAVGTTRLGDFDHLAGWVEPGGWLLWGDLFFRGAPVPAFVAAGLDYDTDAGWRARGQTAGLELVDTRISEEADWEAYVTDLIAAVAAWGRENPDDPQRPALEARARALATMYGPAGREALGFGLYLFRRPGMKTDGG